MHNNSRSVGDIRTYDPRAKLYILLLYIVETAVTWKLYPVLVSVLTGLIILVMSHIPFANLLKCSRSAVAIELVLSVILIFVLPIKMAGYIALKLVLLTFVVNALLRTMKQVELLDGLSVGFGLKAPMAKRMSLMLDYFPRVDREKRRVRRAQIARGVDPEEGNIFERFRKEAMLAVPNHQNSFVKMKRQSAAMDMRQFSSVRRRTRVHDLTMTWVDEVVVIVFVILLLVSVLLMII